MYSPARLWSNGTASYIYGPEDLPAEQISGPEGEEHAQYLHHDQQGSTRLITGEKGETLGTYIDRQRTPRARGLPSSRCRGV